MYFIEVKNAINTKSASGKPLFLLPSQTLLSSLPRRFAPAYCLLPPAYCLLPPAYCLLPTASCLLSSLPRRFAPASLRPAYCLLPPAYCLLSSLPRRFAPASLRPAYCLLPPVLTSSSLRSCVAPACLLPTASCPHFLVASLLRRSGLPPASCLLPPASCLLPPASPSF